MHHRYRNVADYIIFVDAKTCPLIKEYATAYFFARAEDIVDSSSSEKLQERADLLKELMIAVLRKSNNSTTFDNGGASSMTVDALRGKLDQKGMDEDGSKIILVSRLEESNSMEELNKRQRIE